VLPTRTGKSTPHNHAEHSGCSLHLQECHLILLFLVTGDTLFSRALPKYDLAQVSFWFARCHVWSRNEGLAGGTLILRGLSLMYNVFLSLLYPLLLKCQLPTKCGSVKCPWSTPFPLQVCTPYVTDLHGPVGGGCTFSIIQLFLQMRVVRGLVLAEAVRMWTVLSRLIFPCCSRHSLLRSHPLDGQHV
jgi:hypothetical protein